MTAASPRLETATDIEGLVAALIESGRHIQPVEWQGQPAWLKLSVPPPPAWRYRLLATLARVVRQPAIQPVRPQGGAAGLRNEMRRFAELAAAGVRVPALLMHGNGWLLIADLGQTTLESLIRHASPEAQLEYWLRGADYIRHVHGSGQYLSQAFARNFVWSAEGGLGAIDFEDDPATVMSLTNTQIRDWLPYLFSTAVYFKDRLPTLCEQLHRVLADEHPNVRRGVQEALGRLAWLRLLQGLPASLQRRDVLKTQSFGELAHICRQHADRLGG